MQDELDFDSFLPILRRHDTSPKALNPVGFPSSRGTFQKLISSPCSGEFTSSTARFPNFYRVSMPSCILRTTYAFTNARQ